jgi:hypothetical protein
VAFLDDDNEWEPTYLERQVETLRASRAGVAYCQSVEVSDQATLVHPEQLPEGDVFGWVERAWYPRLSAVIVRRDELDAIGGFAPQLRVGEDRDLLTRLAMRTPFAATSDQLVRRHRDEAVRLSVGLQMHDFLAVAEAVGATIVHQRGRRAYASWLRRNVGAAAQALTLKGSQGRRPARDALRVLAGALPWSLPTMLKLSGVWVLGPGMYGRARRVYRIAPGPRGRR